MELDRYDAMHVGALAKQLRNATDDEMADPFYVGAEDLVISMAAEALTRLTAVDGARDPELVKSLDWYAGTCRGCKKQLKVEAHAKTCDWQ